jgi:hypothetical protein
VKRAPEVSMRDGKRNEMKVAEEYYWAMTLNIKTFMLRPIGLQCLGAWI